MDQTTFAAVDEYIKQRMGHEDHILVRARESGARSTMPEANVSSNQGRFLNILAQACLAKNILEIGTLVGYSTIWLARALPRGGKLVTIEYEKVNCDIARENIAQANLGEIVTICWGRALDVLPEIEKTQSAPFDFVFIDADKPAYVDYLNWAIKLSRRGSLIVLDNVIRGARILNEQSSDPKVIGVQRLNDYLRECQEADFTILQMVGEKEYDGMAIGVRK